MKPVARRLKKNMLMRTIWENGITTVAAVAATAPISLMTFEEVSILGLIVNPIVLGMIPLLMYLGLIGVTFGIIWVPLAIPACWLAFPIARLWSGLIIFAGSMPIGVLKMSFNWWTACGWWLIIFGLAIVGRARKQ